MTPTFTIAIATYNRAGELGDCLEGLSRLAPVTDQGHEVIVADNNSSDETRDVVERWMPEFGGRLRYEFVGTQGKAHALNHAIEIMRGEFLALTDDDARVDPNWLRAAATGIRDHPEAAGFGGRVVAQWSTTPVPPWLAVEGPYRLHKCAVSGHDLGPDPRVYKKGDSRMAMPVGVNLFLSRRALERHGGFRTDLWPGEDTEMALRLWRAGERLVYLPDAIVYHPVDPERLTKPYFRRWFHDKARSMMRMEVEIEGTRITGVPRYLLRMALVEALRWVAAIGDPVRRFHHECQLSGIWGQVQEARSLARRARG
jgi:GT2 family glycosyltransferase